MDATIQEAVRDFVHGPLDQFVVELGKTLQEPQKDEWATKRLLVDLVIEHKRLKAEVAQLTQPIAAVSPNGLFLKVSEVEIAPSPESFVPASEFVLSSRRVKFGYMGEGFRRRYLSNKSEQDWYHVISRQVLRRRSTDSEITKTLGRDAETTLGDLFSLLLLQPEGGSGELLIEGSNVFYIRDLQGVLGTVQLCWANNGWDLSDYPTDAPRGWKRGEQVFSCVVVAQGSFHFMAPVDKR